MTATYPAGPIRLSLIWRASRVRTWATIVPTDLLLLAHASCTASRIVAMSRMEIRSTSSICSTRCRPPTVMIEGTRSATSFCCSCGSPARIFCASVYDRNSEIFSFTTSARWVVRTVAGSTTVQFADRA